MSKKTLLLFLCCTLYACRTSDTSMARPDPSPIDETNTTTLRTVSKTEKQVPIEKAQRPENTTEEAPTPESAEKAHSEPIEDDRNDASYAVTCCTDGDDGRIRELQGDAGRSMPVPRASVRVEKPKGQVEFGDVGKLDALEECDMASIEKIMRKANTRFLKCYERELAHDPSLAGAIRVSVHVSERGRSTDIEVIEDGLAREQVASCLENNMKRFSYPKQACGFTQTLTFAPLTPRDDP